LFVPSAVLLIVLAYANRIDIVAALERRAIPGFVLHVCVMGWVIVGVPLTWRIYANIRERDEPVHPNAAVISAAFFTISLFAFAQHVFRSQSYRETRQRDRMPRTSRHWTSSMESNAKSSAIPFMSTRRSAIQSCPNQCPRWSTS
jgi:hypothetical protein